MRWLGTTYELSASDLVGYLNCNFLTNLDRAVAGGVFPKPHGWDPSLQLLAERGALHEKSYVDYLTKQGHQVLRIEGVQVTSEATELTLAAMRRGVDVIVQGSLEGNGWVGRADVLRRTETPSDLGSWSYEPIDTKLAQATKAGAVIQLCLYADLLGSMQGVPPENLHVVVPWSDFEPQRFRFADYAAYFRKVKNTLTAFVDSEAPLDLYPEPIEHCEICRWQESCDKRRRADDHPSLVAGISKLQIDELKQNGTPTLGGLAQLPLPLPWKPSRGSPDSYVRIREQARVQYEARINGDLRHELLPVQDGFGLARLPSPSQGDVFLDLEGDPFVGEHGLEYLFGWLVLDDHGQPSYSGEWAFTRADEKSAFERFVDLVMARWAQHSDLHIYHYAHYEPSAFKRLMGRYATREEELDRMLRAGLFVDLFQVVRQGLRASVESYSIKRLEPFYGFGRQVPLAEANVALAAFEANLELADAAPIPDEAKAIVLKYNMDDCLSALSLRGWLESLRTSLTVAGIDVPRPMPGDGAPNETITDWLSRIGPLIEKLTADVPAEPLQRNAEQQARWILGNVLDFHRREEKSVWWEYFRLADLSVEDLRDERAGLSGLSFLDAVGGTAKAPIHRYEFPPQETELRSDDDLHSAGGDKLGKVVEVSFENRTIDIKKRQDSVAVHPDAIFSHNYVGGKVMAESLARLCEHVVDHGFIGGGPFLAARDLLLRTAPRIGGQPIRLENETAVQSAVRLCRSLEPGILPIQGPPGAGKTFTAAEMICELVGRGKTVGITANSHKVIRNVIDAVIKAADERGMVLDCCQKADEFANPQHRLTFAKRIEDLLSALGNKAQVGGATAWLWSRPDAFEAVDVLFVDEAAQMSLANVLAVSQAAKTVVLIGDPQQLDQPIQGSHPEGTDISALDHILAGNQTISPDKGLFLEKTWRLHPSICEFTSELFYDDKLRSLDGLEKQAIGGEGPIRGAGLWYLPVVHSGNQNSSEEEAAAIAAFAGALLKSRSTWINRDGAEKDLALDDLMVITPYNAQVFEVQRHLPGVRAGTVDKFQGQEAPIAIYSTATSTFADAPRGMEFLYSLNRLNVATSRAKCACLMVASPQLFEAECRTPRQIQLANAFCRYLERAKQLRL